MTLQVEIQKKVPDFTIDVAFSCAPGQLLAVVGPSGSGKTTIIRTIAGLEQPESGRIVNRDTVWLDTARRTMVPARKRQLGYVFQEHTLFPHLSIEQNVAFAADDPRAVAAYLKLFGIEDLRRRRPQQVSGGERQRAALAQALARNPQVLLLDEPFSALDVVTRRKLRADLSSMKERLRIPIIHVTHDLEEASALADRVLAIERGHIARDWFSRIPPTAAVKDQTRLALLAGLSG